MVLSKKNIYDTHKEGYEAEEKAARQAAHHHAHCKLSALPLRGLPQGKRVDEMSAPEWIQADPLASEAYKHGRTQERLRIAVESLRLILKTCERKDRSGLRYKLLEIEANAATTLKRLSAATGGIIDDMEPTQ